MHPDHRKPDFRSSRVFAKRNSSVCKAQLQINLESRVAMFRTFLLACFVAAASGLAAPRAPMAQRSALASRATPLMSADADGFVPDMERRTIMNNLLVATTAVPGLWLAGGFAYFFAPPGGGGGGGGVTAHDALGDDVVVEKWLATHPAGDRKLVEGLKGDATYLIVTADKKIETYALNAVCTHLGCVVPWNPNAQKFICPCHGSQYDASGKVVRGPAPLSLALAHVVTDSGKVVLNTWTETDFRTNLAPWWK